MEKIKVEKETKEKIIHKFYCDDCKKFLGESEEYEDGYYYDKFGSFDKIFCVDSTRFEIHKHFCNECEKKFKENIVKYLKQLEQLGFKRVN